MAGPIQVADNAAAPPPHPLDAEWHVNLNGQNYGPYSGHQLKQYAQEGRVSADSQVVRLGATDWHRIGDDLLAAMGHWAQDHLTATPPGDGSVQNV